ncbi:LmrA/YxaF family transcription factor [Streptomyces sp. NPDC001153]
MQTIALDAPGSRSVAAAATAYGGPAAIAYRRSCVDADLSNDARHTPDLTEALTAHGAAPDRAPGLAALVVAAAEGAIAMCRAQRSMRPLDRVAQELETLLTDALARPA